MGVIDDMDWDDEYHDAYEDAFAGYHTKKRYNQGKHTRSYEAYDQHHITCKKCGAVGLSWGQVDGRWKLFSPSNELHICITGKAPVVEINLPQKIAEMQDYINEMGIEINFDEQDPYAIKLAMEQLPKQIKKAIAAIC